MEFTSILAEIPFGIIIAVALSIGLWAFAFARRAAPGKKKYPLVRATAGMLATFAVIALAMASVGPAGGLWTLLPQLTKIFIVAILALWGYVFFYRFTSVTVAAAPTVLTTLGIFGTFVGVAWGLSGFNADNIQGSMPVLLDGLNTSFWSSVVGIGGAVSIKLRHLILVSFIEDKEVADYDVTMDDLARLLRSVNESLGASEQSTVVNELMLLRKDSNDRLDSLGRLVDDFVKETVARLNEQSREIHEHVASHAQQLEPPRQTS